MWVAQWIIAAAIVVGLFLGAIQKKVWKFLQATGAGKHPDVASMALRKATAQTLLSESPRLQSFETAEFLLNIAVDLYERKHAAMSALDDKAQKLVGLIGGGAALFALLGGLNGSYRVPMTPLLVLSGLCFLGSLGLALTALFPRDTTIPTISLYNSPKVLEDPNFRAKIARQLIETWEQIALEISPLLHRKGLAVFFSMVLIAVGAFALLSNFLLQRAAATPSSVMQKVRCSGSIRLHKPNRLELTCEEARVNPNDDEAEYGKPSPGGRQPLTEGWKPDADSDKQDNDD
jgi:hypothetical protein